MEPGLHLQGAQPRLHWVQHSGWNPRQQARAQAIARQLAQAGEHDGQVVLAASVDHQQLQVFAALYSQGLMAQQLPGTLSTVSSALLVLDRSGEQALLERRALGLPGAGRWHVPGGYLQPGETPLQAALREAREELGLEPGLLGRPQPLGWALRADGQVGFWYLARASAELPLRPDPEEVMQVGWCSVRHPPPLWGGHLPRVLEHVERHPPA